MKKLTIKDIVIMIAIILVSTIAMTIYNDGRVDIWGEVTTATQGMWFGIAMGIWLNFGYCMHKFGY